MLAAVQSVPVRPDVLAAVCVTAADRQVAAKAGNRTSLSLVRLAVLLSAAKAGAVSHPRYR